MLPLSIFQIFLMIGRFQGLVNFSISWTFRVSCTYFTSACNFYGVKGLCSTHRVLLAKHFKVKVVCNFERPTIIVPCSHTTWMVCDLSSQYLLIFSMKHFFVVCFWDWTNFNLCFQLLQQILPPKIHCYVSHIVFEFFYLTV